MDLHARFAGFEAPFVLDLLVVDVPLRVRANEQEICARLGAYYEPYVVRHAAAPQAEVRLFQGIPRLEGEFRDVQRRDGRQVKEAVRDVPGGRLIVKRMTGVLMGLLPASAFAVGDLRANLNQAVNLINACYAKIALDRGFALLHAAGLSWRGRTAVLAGVPGVGKSTAALHLVEEGFHFLSNDRVLARPSGPGVEALGYPKQPRVNPGTLLHHRRLSRLLTLEDRAVLRQLSREELWRLERKADVDLDAIYGKGTVELKGRMEALVLLKWGLDEDKAAVRRLTAAEAVANLSLFEKDLGVFDLDRSEAPRDQVARRARYAAILERVDIVEVTGGVEFPALVDLVGELLAK